MKEESAIDIDRAKFAKYVEGYWLEIRAGNSKKANALVRSGDNIVDRWVKKGVVIDFLLPLLTHSSDAVRFAAAAHLINYDAKEQAILVLRDLIKNCTNLIASSAKAVLRLNKIL